MKYRNTYREEDAIHIYIILYLCIFVCLGVRDDGVMALNQKQRVEEFIDRWRGRGDEKQETQLFWLDLMQNVLGLQHAIESTKFEYKTAGNGFIDVLCPDARFLVEQKSSDIDLDKPEPRQGTMVTPVQQAVRYSDNLPLSLKPSKICVCNFRRFRLYDLEADPRAKGEPADDFALEDLYDHLGNLISVFGKDNSRIMHEQHLSEHAGLLVANLHNALAAQYADPDAPQSHHSLAVLTVRLVFCLYAEDAGLFKPNAFSQYIESYDAAHLRRAVIDLFHVLNTKFEDRDPYLEDELKAFPYVNGGLFANPIEIPQFTDAIRDSLLAAGKGFNWRQISPVIFGSLMEETLSHDQRRQGGMHYTTVKNIHRVINPLFLDDLSAELDRIEKDQTIGDKARSHRLRDYQDKLAGLRFLDPACGSGNFLTETFLRLRELENRALGDMLHDQGYLELGGENSLVKVSIDQFYGIEINDFAVAVSKTALWIAEQQALDDTEAIAGQAISHLPLHDSGNIVCANALRYDWNELLPGGECDYVMGNPPFIGQYLKGQDQTEDMRIVWGKDYDGYLDYATGWYRKASQYLTKPNAQFALVSTNSITQGVPVPSLFKPIVGDGWRIRFAHRTFGWDAQSTDMAHVHVVIIGMDKADDTTAPPTLYTYQKLDSDPELTHPRHINGYLLDGPDVYVEKRSQKVGPLGHGLNFANRGSQPTDGGNLILDTKEDYDKAMSDCIAAKYVRQFRMGREMINGIDRWCLWLTNAEPSDLRGSAFLRNRIEACRQMRLASKKAPTRESAATPWLFQENHQPDVDYLAIPSVFSGRREYATCDYYSSSIIAGNKIYTSLDPDGFNFAIIESAMFMAWQKGIGGRLKSDCNFSNTLVWNTLPLPPVDTAMHAAIVAAGKNILAVRANHPKSSLADLYDPTFMPKDLRDAHQNLDKVVDVAFGAKSWLKGDNDARLQILFDDYVRLIG